MRIRYQPNIDTLENLQYVSEIVDGFNQDRYLAALMGKRTISKEKVVEMRIRLSEINDKLELEYANLESFGRTFNEQFVTTNNAYFSSAMTLLRKVRSGMSEMIKIYRKFAPKTDSVKQPVNLDEPLDLYSRSSMAGAEYTPPLFDIEHFTPEVKDLYETMKKFMLLMNNCFQFCEDIIEEEALIRKNPEACLELYKDFKEQHYRKIKEMLHSIDIQSRDFMAENNSAIRLRKESKDEYQFSQKGYHNLTESATIVLATKELVEDAQRGEFSKEEMMLFAENMDNIYRIRYIISHFDQYLPQNYKRQKLPSSYLACMMSWSKAKEDLAFVNYFQKTYIEAGGQHKPPSNSAVNQSKRSDWTGIEEFAKLICQWENVEIA